jgi:putative transposase
VLPKEAWLEHRGVAGKWPCWGFPSRIHLDNAKEFHGEMLRRACEQYGIALDYRPPATPHMGGHIERLVGTLMRALHELPGATFSNPKQRGNYDSEAIGCADARRA